MNCNYDIAVCPWCGHRWVPCTATDVEGGFTPDEDNYCPECKKPIQLVVSEAIYCLVDKRVEQPQ